MVLEFCKHSFPYFLDCFNSRFPVESEEINLKLIDILDFYFLLDKASDIIVVEYNRRSGMTSTIFLIEAYHFCSGVLENKSDVILFDNLTFNKNTLTTLFNKFKIISDPVIDISKGGLNRFKNKDANSNLILTTSISSENLRGFGGLNNCIIDHYDKAKIIPLLQMLKTNYSFNKIIITMDSDDSSYYQSQFQKNKLIYNLIKFK